MEKMSRLKRELKTARDEGTYIRKQLIDNHQASVSREPEQLASLRKSFGDLTELYEKEKAKLQQLKIQMAYEQQAVKDVEAELESL